MWSVAPSAWNVYALAFEILILVLTVVDLASHRLSQVDLRWFAILLALGVGQAEMSRRIERMRRWMGGQTHINVTSVWLVAGAVLLSPGWVSLLAGLLYLHLWARVWRHVRSRPAHRVVASTAFIMLSSFAASYAVRVFGLGDLADVSHSTVQGTAVVLIAAAVFELVNVALVAVSLLLYTKERSVTDLLGTGADNALELVTLCLGGLLALALVYQPFLALLVFPPLVM